MRAPWDGPAPPCRTGRGGPRGSYLISYASRTQFCEALGSILRFRGRATTLPDRLRSPPRLVSASRLAARHDQACAGRSDSDERVQTQDYVLDAEWSASRSQRGHTASVAGSRHCRLGTQGATRSRTQSRRVVGVCATLSIAAARDRHQGVPWIPLRVARRPLAVSTFHSAPGRPAGPWPPFRLIALRPPRTPLPLALSPCSRRPRPPFPPLRPPRAPSRPPTPGSARSDSQIDRTFWPPPRSSVAR